MNLEIIKNLIERIKIGWDKQELYIKVVLKTTKQKHDCEQLLKILQKAQIIRGYNWDAPTKCVRIFLRYDTRGSAIIYNIKSVSKRSKRLRMTCLDIERFLNVYPYATVVIRTNKSWVLAKEALNTLTGGEIIASII